MEIQVQKLRAALALVKPAVMKASEQQVAADAVLILEGTITAINRSVAISMRLAEAEENDYFLLPFSQTVDLLRNLNGQQTVTITRAIPGTQVQISNGQGLSSRMLAGDPQQYPEFPADGATPRGEVDGDLFIKHLMEMVPYVARTAQEQERTALTGVYVKVEKQAILAATDGNRLAHQRINTGFEDDQAPPMILPIPMIRMLNTVWKNTLKPITVDRTIGHTLHRPGIELARVALAKRYLTISWGGEVFTCGFGGITMACQVVDGVFPDYNRVIMGEADHNIVVDAFDLNRGIGQILPVAQGSNVPICLEWEPMAELLVLSAHSAEVGEVRTAVRARVKSDIGGRIAFNVDYLRDFLKGKEGRVLFECTTESKSARWTATRGPVYQVMPMSVNWD